MKKEDKNIAKQAEQEAMGYLESKYPGEKITDDASVFGGVKIREKFKPDYHKKYEEIYKKIELKEGDSKKEKKSVKKPTEKEVIADLTDTLQRTQAEFENYKKRVEKEKAEFAKYAEADLMQKLLPTIDTFEIALKSAKIEDFRDTGNPKDFQVNTKDSEKFVKGMEMVHAQLISLLHSEGLRPIEATGKRFDPYLHEVMLKEKSDKDDGVVLEEMQKGYMLNGRVLRHSKVKISEKAEKEEAKKEEKGNEKVQ